MSRPLALALALVATAAPARAGLLNLTGVTAGTSGSFTGTLDGIGVTGSISAPNFDFRFSPIGPGYTGSTTDDGSPQYSYSSVYSLTAPGADRVGYGFTSFQGLETTATVTITFGSAVRNPIFQVANLDRLQFDFTPTDGLAGLVLLKGNGDGLDGLQVAGKVISDVNPDTAIAVDPTITPPTFTPTTSVARSAYGSVQLLGSFKTLEFTVSNPRSGDGGSFTLGTVPEPTTLAMAAAGLLGVAGCRRAARAKAGRTA